MNSLAACLPVRESAVWDRRKAFGCGAFWWSPYHHGAVDLGSVKANHDRLLGTSLDSSGLSSLSGIL